MIYNTARAQIGMREYGRHIQKMVDFMLTIEDKEKRQKNANSAVELMAILNPQLKTIEDYKHKLWDHLFVISDFKLDVESPYPIPTRESVKAKPDPLPYPNAKIKFNHLGKLVERLIEKALVEPDAEKKQGFSNTIAYYMKLTYSTWHKELVHDDNIQAELSDITDGALAFNNRPFVKHKADNRPIDDYGYGNNGRNKQRNKNFGGRNNNNRNNNNNNRNNNNGGGNRNNNNNNGNNRNKKRF
jgi:hypothetical protein